MANKETEQLPHCLKEIIPVCKRIHYSDVYSSDEDSSSEHHTSRICSLLPNRNDYVVVRLTGKKVMKHFVGVVLEIDLNKELTVKFLKKCGPNKFLFPDKDDISLVMPSEIVCVLSTPSLNKIKEYTFPNLPKLENLY